MSTRNPRDPMLPLGSAKCRCSTCGLYFNSPHGFDRHRVGKIGAPDRRCLTVAELLLAGWSTNTTGHWITSKRPAASTPCDAGAPTTSTRYAGKGDASAAAASQVAPVSSVPA
jgi:hypothetical protein